ncbi:Trimeric LpxA-like protein [Pseudocohnilembus persalinus]|uniref:Dynactin subunit 6 n=1 Tax=Pseudocohnilembus persalinus TaxID=266149 RepID=A0A0V0QBX0_PSEPJ|nr:Trimeric LpxA-like protein [Pseudocohnilembus persalinus]|eukprot:KRW99741.1 Trimeric LpxA-like protein [Pseudocohnilembus persalinus]
MSFNPQVNKEAQKVDKQKEEQQSQEQQQQQSQTQQQQQQKQHTPNMIDPNLHYTIIPDQTKDIQGNIKFGKGCVVHPGSSITVQEGAGPIIFGDYNIIEERCYITNKVQKDGSVKTMYIGNYNLFEVDSKINSSNIGDFNQFEPRCILERNCEIKNGCTIGATVQIPSNSKFNNNTKIHWPEKLGKDQNFDEESHKQGIISLYESLATILPQYQKIQRLKPSQ